MNNRPAFSVKLNYLTSQLNPHFFYSREIIQQLSNKKKVRFKDCNNLSEQAATDLIHFPKQVRSDDLNNYIVNLNL